MTRSLGSKSRQKRPDGSRLGQAFKIKLQSASHRPMMPTGMTLINQHDQTGHVCAVCGGLSTSERGTNHLWTTPTPNPAQQSEAANVPATVVLDDTGPITAVAEVSLIELRQSLADLTSGGHSPSGTLRDSFDPTRSITVDV